MAKKKETVYVVTSTDMGCDCVVGVFSNEECAEQRYGDKEGYHVSPMRLNNDKPKIYEFKYTVKPWDEVKDLYLVMDVLLITSSDMEFEDENSKPSMTYMAELFDEFCQLKEVDCGNIYLSQYCGEGWVVVCDKWNDDESPSFDWIPSDSDLIWEFDKWCGARAVSTF